MQQNKSILPQELYLSYLKEIGKIKFSQREIDIISCLLHGRSAKKIASFLSISPKTVAAHVRNIMLKLECNSRDGILDFVEKSEEYNHIKLYYACLIVQTVFENILKDIKKRNSEKQTYLLMYWKEFEEEITILHFLENHLKMAGFNIRLEGEKGDEFIANALKDGISRQENYVLCSIPLIFLEDLNALKKSTISSFLQRAISNKEFFLFLFLKKDVSTPIPKEFSQLNYVDFSGHQNYYLIIFDILKKLSPNMDIGTIEEDFKKRCEVTLGTLQSPSFPSPLENSNLEKDKTVKKISFLFEATPKKLLFPILGFISLIILGGFFLYANIFHYNNLERNPSLSLYQKISETPSVRSDLNVPVENVLLNRPNLMTQIDAKIQGEGGIRTVAIIGPGGAGKTTLARQYARQQNAGVVWEINAETPESLVLSFEKLAQALSKKEEDKKALIDIQETKDQQKKEDKLIQFVKGLLHTHSPWFLVYDNVENFTDIMNRFPCNSETWGHGKVILTTRDSNIGNNKNVNDTLSIGELNPTQKLSLFTSIMTNGNNQLFIQGQTEEATKFLKEIPPFPLDVSVAAYYIKTTEIPFSQYLVQLQKHDKDFESVQEEILNEGGQYTKTRFKIITLSLTKLMESHKDFEELLHFISLLDSENIPVDLLKKHKGEVIVDNFIFHLKKYSLIYNKRNPSSTDNTISLHRCTQEILSNYLGKEINLNKNKNKNKNKNINFIQSIGTTLEKHISEILDKRDVSKIKILIPHCEKIDQNKTLDPSKIMTLEVKLGAMYNELHNYKRAQQVLEKSLLSSKQIPHQTIQALSYLGINARLQGDSEKALKLLEKSLKVYNDNSSKDKVLLARILSYLGFTYKDLGDFKKSRDILEEALLLYQSQCKNCIIKGWALALLGNVYRELGEYKIARELLEKSLLFYKTNYPKNNEVYALNLTYLAFIFRDIGYYDKATDLLNQALAINRKSFGDNNSRTAWTLGHLGAVYQMQRKYEEASEALEKALLIYKEHYSEKNSNKLAWLLHRISNLYINLGNYKLAHKYLEEILIAYEKKYGTDHLQMGPVFESLGKLYFIEGNSNNAEKYFQLALTIFQKNNHPDYFSILEAMADLYKQKSRQAMNDGDFQQAQYLEKKSEDYLKQALKMTKNNFPKDSPHISRIQLKLNSLK